MSRGEKIKTIKNVVKRKNINTGYILFILFIKNAVAESHGARGYYLEFKLENDSTDPVELFSVGSSVMKSFP